MSKKLSKSITVYFSYKQRKKEIPENIKNLKYLILDNYKKYDMEILFMIEFKKENFIPYDINLLLEYEKLELFNNIEKQKKLLKVVHNINQNKSFIGYSINFNNLDNIDLIYQKLDQQIEIFYKEIEEYNKYFKEENKCFFERALLELEIKDF